ncbi:MAG: hypothetical protein EOM76_11395 [Sphingobacteriia bacterium]|nr:hypothetical protein [Sphingobacteriia bacterium]
MKKKLICQNSDGISYSAAMSILFLHYKILDNICDNQFFKRLKWYFLKLITYPAYQKAKKLYPDQEAQINQYIHSLHKLEESKCSILDEPAGLFADILQTIGGSPIQDANDKRIVKEILRNIGRWIYIIDAFEDMEEDEKNGAYNPLFYRFEKSPKENIDIFRQRIKGDIDFTLTQSLAICTNDFSLLENRNFNPILHNIIYLGLRAKQQTIIARKGDRTENGSL